MCVCVCVRERERNREGEVEILFWRLPDKSSGMKYKKKRRVDGDSGIRVWWRKNQEKKKEKIKKRNAWIKERKRIRYGL